MSTTRVLRSRTNRNVGGLSRLDVGAALLLSAWAVALTSGLERTGHRHGGAAASIGVLAMTLPVAWRRRAPIAAAATLGVAAVLNGLLFGSMVRCGPALPAVFLVAFALGSGSSRGHVWAGLILCAGNVVAQAFYDPQLGAATVVVFLPVLAGFFAIGRLARSRSAAAESLRQRSIELLGQREETARLAVVADRAQVTRDLEGTLHERIDAIATSLAAGRDALAVDLGAATHALASIEHEGREVLHHMREVVGTLHDEAPLEPQPTLAQLSDLLARATSADTRLSVEGTPRVLPAGLELASYRIVEHLLSALVDAPQAAIDVRLRFAPDALELSVSGPPAPSVDLRAVLASARQRAALHGGTIEDTEEERVCRLVARLPLVSGYA
jgi:signal transduction histidine kinase